MYPYDHCTIIYNSQDMEATQVPINRWMDKEVVIHTHTHTHICVCMYVCIYIYVYICDGILLNHKKNEILPFATTWMDPEGIMLSEISQTEKDKYCMISFIWNLKKQNKWTNITKHRITNTENKQVVSRGEVGCKDERNRWGRLRGTNFQLQNKWATGMKCTV